MTVRAFLQTQRQIATAELQSAIERGSAGRTNSIRDRIALIDWLLDGAEDMTPPDLREALEGVISGSRQVHGLQAPVDSSGELLRRLAAQSAAGDSPIES